MNLDCVNRVLDVGSGLGQFAYRMATEISRTYSQPFVLGVEKDTRQLRQCQKLHSNEHVSNVKFREGDATDLPLLESEWNSFDLVHCRFVLEHSPTPDQIVSQMAEAVKPGGQIFVVDDDHDLLRLSPDCNEVASLWYKYWNSYQVLGCDPLIGRRVPELFGNAGLEVVEVNTLFFGATKGEPLFELVVDNLVRVMNSARELMVKHSLATESDFDHASESISNWRDLKNATVWYSLPYTVGMRV